MALLFPKDVALLSAPFNPFVRFPILDGGFPVLVVSLFVVQIYRYRCVSTLVQRQQTRWVIFGITGGFVGFLITVGLFVTFPEPFSNGTLLRSIALGFTYLFILLIPLSFGVAILRNQLWDIDAIINKALVCGLLSGLLAALYAGLIIGLESLAGLIAGQAAINPPVLVISTLAIAALFRPLRRRIQRIIDRRFYRRKYDTARVLAAFSATLRNEVDLEPLSDQLVAVVQETMQPTHVSLWLRQPGRRDTPSLQAGKPPL